MDSLLVLVPAADHESGDILKENQGDTPLRTELHEMRALLRGL